MHLPGLIIMGLGICGRYLLTAHASVRCVGFSTPCAPGMGVVLLSEEHAFAAPSLKAIAGLHLPSPGQSIIHLLQPSGRII